MFFIESERLKLIPLTYNQLLLCDKDRAALERSLNLNFSSMVVDDLFKSEINDALQEFWLPNTKIYPDLYQWYTSWEIVLKSTNTIIGGIGFGGYPNDHGETTVGYMTDQQHWSQGYATEALNALAGWGFSFSILKAITADTPVGNLASQRVLIKAQFKQTHTRDGLLYFKRVKA